MALGSAFWFLVLPSESSILFHGRQHVFTDGRVISLLPTIKISERECLTTSLCFILSL